MDHYLPGEEPTSAAPPIGVCQSYRPGHQSHWIMWKQYRSIPRKPAVIRDIQGTAILIEFDGSSRVWHHHEPARVVAVLVKWSGNVSVIEECTTITIGRGSTHWFYCTADILEPCI